MDTLYGYNGLVLAWSIHFWKKDTPNSPNYRGKTFHKTQYLIISLYLNFCTKIRSFWFFGHPVGLKMPCISLVYPFLKKAPQMHNITKTKLFMRAKICIISLYLKFCTKIRPFWFFGHPVCLKWSCICLVYPFLNKLGLS